MKKIKLLSAIIAAVLIVCIVFSGRGVSYLSAETQKDTELETQYLKEVKMFYAESAEQAKKYCEEEGYIFCPENLKEASYSDLQAYLGYKTTKDKGDAVTDSDDATDVIGLDLVLVVLDALLDQSADLFGSQIHFLPAFLQQLLFQGPDLGLEG